MERELTEYFGDTSELRRVCAAQLLWFILWLEKRNKEHLIRDFQNRGPRPAGIVLDKIVVVSWLPRRNYSKAEVKYGTCGIITEKLNPRFFDSFEELIEHLTEEGHLE